jgi:hypothetical protein
MARTPMSDLRSHLLPHALRYAALAFLINFVLCMRFFAILCGGSKGEHSLISELSLVHRETPHFDLHRLLDENDTKDVVHVQYRDSEGAAPEFKMLGLEREQFNSKAASVRWSWMAMHIRQRAAINKLCELPIEPCVEIALRPAKRTSSSSCLPQISI